MYRNIMTYFCAIINVALNKKILWLWAPHADASIFTSDKKSADFELTLFFVNVFLLKQSLDPPQAGKLKRATLQPRHFDLEFVKHTIIPLCNSFPQVENLSKFIFDPIQIRKELVARCGFWNTLLSNICLAVEGIISLCI